MSLEEENKNELLSIVRLVTRATKVGKFVLTFANCNSLLKQEFYIKKMHRSFQQKGITMMPVELWDKPPIDDLYLIIKDHLELNFHNKLPDKLTITITGLEISILLDPNESFPKVLQNLNIARERYREKLPYPLIIWLPDYAFIKLATIAPDFWSVRYGSFTFSNESDESIIDSKKIINEGKNIARWQDKVYQIPLIKRILEGKQTSPKIIIDLMLKMGDAYFFINRMEEAKRYYEDALDHSTRKDIGFDGEDEMLDRQGKALNGLGIVYTEMNNFSEAISKLSEFLAIRQKQGKKEGEAIAHNHLGLAYDQQGDYEKAVNHYQQAIEIYGQLGLQIAEKGDVLGNIGLTFRKINRFKDAIEKHKNALSISKEIGDLQRQTKDLGNIGLVYYDMGNYEDAIDYYSMALELSKRTGNKWDEFNQLMNIGNVLKKLADFGKALDSYSDAISIARKIGNKDSELDAFKSIIKLYTPDMMSNIEKEIEWIKKIINRSDELEKWEIELHYIEKLIDIYQNQINDNQKKRDWLLENERLLRRILENPNDDRNAIAHCQRIIEIQYELSKKVDKEYQQLLKELLDKRPAINIWLDSKRIKTTDADNSLILAAKWPYNFYFQIGIHELEYTWIFHRDFQYNKFTEGVDIIETKESHKISAEISPKKEKLLKKSPSVSTLIPSKEVKPKKESSEMTVKNEGHSIGILPKTTPHSEPKFIPEMDTQIVSFTLKEKGIQFKPDKVELSLPNLGNNSEIKKVRIFPEKTGLYNIKISASTKDLKFKDEFEIRVNVEEEPILSRATVHPIEGRFSYDKFGAIVTGGNVSFRLFFPDNSIDHAQYRRGGLPRIEEIRVVGDFQHHIGSRDWEPVSAPVMKKEPHLKGWLYTHKIEDELPEGFYQYKYYVLFENGTKRLVSDPCSKYGGQNGNSGFVIGGITTKFHPIQNRQPLQDLIIYEMMLDDFTYEFRGSKTPIDAVFDKLDYLESLGINAIMLMPLTPWLEGKYNWGYDPFLFFAIEYSYIHDPDKPFEKLYKLKTLINELHRRNIHVIINGVFNHANGGGKDPSGFPYKWLYQNPEDSPFIGNYGMTGFFDDLDYNNTCVQEFVRDVCIYWLDVFQIDGILFDYSLGYYKKGDSEHGIPRLISDIREFLSRRGEENVSLILEHLTDNRFDAINDTNQINATGCMFEPFMFSSVNYAVSDNIDMEILRILNANMDFAKEKSPVLYIENHDHSTIINNVGGRSRWFKTVPIAITLLTSPGAVLIHNGQEFGEDYYLPYTAEDRIIPRPLKWSKHSTDDLGKKLYKIYQKLIKIRKEHPSIRSGDFFPYPENQNGYGVFQDRKIIIFQRSAETFDGKREIFVIAVNYSDNQQRVDIPFPENGVWKDLLNGDSVTITNFILSNHSILPNWGKIYYKKSITISQKFYNL